MGAYLTKPITTKESFDETNENFACGGSEMQGWRVSMEDAHSCILDYDDDLSLFAVYDGHGGSEVASYTAENLPTFLKRTDEYKDGNLKDCLINGFLQFDQHLISEEVLAELRKMAGMNDTGTNDSEIAALREEAEMPIDELMLKLKEGGYHIEGINEGSEEADDGDNEEDDNVLKGDNEEEDEKGSEACASIKDSANNNIKKDETKTSNDEKPAQEMKSSCEAVKNKSAKVNGEKTKDVKENVNEKNDEEEEDESEEDEEDEGVDEEDEEEDENQTQWHDGDEVAYDSGTTAVVALLRKDRLVVANVGDSRCILCRNDIAIDMSTDHKPDDDRELQRIKKAGGKVTAEGRVNGGLNLSRALGDHRYKGKGELGADEQQITAFPDVLEIEITEEDKFVVLACDGIWNVLTSQEVVDFVSEQLEKQRKLDRISLSKICEELFDRCLSPDTAGDGTGCDNMTAIIVLPNHKNIAHQAKRKADVEIDKNNCVTKKPKNE